MRVALGSDEAAPLVAALAADLAERGHEVVAIGEGKEWPEVGRQVGEAVVSGSAQLGVCCCWTGTGVAIAANKVTGVRAALCGDAETASGARRYNDANVLGLSLRQTSIAIGREILDAFLSGAPDADEAAAIGRVES